MLVALHPISSWVFSLVRCHPPSPDAVHAIYLRSVQYSFLCSCISCRVCRVVSNGVPKKAFTKVLIHMLTSVTSLLLVLLSTNVHAQVQLDVCDPAKFPSTFTPGFTQPIVQVAQAQVLNSANPIYCSGTFQFVDGCTFMIKNFTFLNAYQSQWYAGVVGTVNGKTVANQNGVAFVSDFVNSVNGQDATFHLIKVPATAYSFFSINELRLFDLTEKEVLCTVELPYNNPNIPSSISGTSNGGSTAAPAGSGAAVSSSSDNTAKPGAGAAATTAKTP
ncbi:hypothetical protein BC830DRAFT_1105707, partial [Chytriomyces sp. MP71]